MALLSQMFVATANKNLMSPTLRYLFPKGYDRRTDRMSQRPYAQRPLPQEGTIGVRDLEKALDLFYRRVDLDKWSGSLQ